jgi:thiamine pyrophosphate-dependent acetolactate synthase large subunit-like protein
MAREAEGATAFGADFVAIARSAGIKQSDWALDEASFEQLVARALAQDGPCFIAARIDEKPAVATTDRDPALLRDRFMRGLGVRE